MRILKARQICEFKIEEREYTLRVVHQDNENNIFKRDILYF